MAPSTKSALALLVVVAGVAAHASDVPENATSPLVVAGVAAEASVGPENTTSPEPTGGQPLFPAGQVPGERNGTIGPEIWSSKCTCLLTVHRSVMYLMALGPIAIAMLMVQRSVSRYADGGSFYNVAVPAMYARIVPSASTIVIVSPGGAYTHLSFELEGESAAQWLNTLNVSVYVLKYRVPLRPWLTFGEAPLMDVQRAIGLVRSWHANATVGVLGFSAGSHLSAHVSTSFSHRAYPRIDAADDESCRPDFALLLYPWCVVGSSAGWHYGSNCGADHNHTLSMIITSATPPTFLCQAEDDPVRMENSLFYYLGLKAAAAPPSELHVFPSGGHGFGLCKPEPNREVCTWTDRAQQWLRAQGLLARR
jgi:acetyl esterase/lipase